MEKLQPHIKCRKGNISKNLLLPGDPGRVPIIAKHLSDAKKIRYNREFFSYNGKYKDVPISVMSTGIGCPSTLIAMEELANIGAENFIRIGTCGGLKNSVKPGDLIIVDSAIKPDGKILGYELSKDPVKANKKITKALVNAAKKLNIRFHKGLNRTHDSFYESTEDFLKIKKEN